MIQTVFVDVDAEQRSSHHDAESFPAQAGGAMPSASFNSSPTQNDRRVCVFSQVLGETHTRAQGFKELYRRLDPVFPERRRIEAKLREGIAGFASLSTALAVDSCMAVLVCGNPTKSLSTSEQQKLVDFIVDGGHLIVAASAGGLVGSNMNDVLSLFGINVNSDSVIRGTFHKYLHPKEVFVSDGAISKNVAEALNASKQDHDNDSSHHRERGQAHSGAEFVYPHGCTLLLKAPAVPLLSSGAAAYPQKASLVAVSDDMTADAKRARGMPLHSNAKICQGRVMVLGSADMLGDEWIDKEQNVALMRCFFDMMVPGKELRWRKGHVRAPDMHDTQLVPDIQSLSCRVRGCLEDADDLPADVTALFNRDMFAFDTSLIPAAVQLYHRLGVEKKPLSLIEPQFEQPLPPLQPAVFPPSMFEPAQPALERFDLDDAFANEYFKLSQLSLTSRKQGGKDDSGVLDDYVIKAAQAVGIDGASKMSAQQALLEVFDQLGKWKLQDAGAAAQHFGEYDDDEGIKI